MKVTAWDCPRIKPDWLKSDRAAIGEWWFAQEYEFEFTDTIDQVFRYDAVMQAVSSEVVPLFGGPTS